MQFCDPVLTEVHPVLPQPRQERGVEGMSPSRKPGQLPASYQLASGKHPLGQCNIWCLLDCLASSHNTKVAPLCAYSKNETQAKCTSEFSLDPPEKGGDPIGQVSGEAGKAPDHSKDIYSRELAETLRSDEVMLEDKHEMLK